MTLERSSFLQQLHLNQEQYQAVTHPPEVPLQILAGPGSGKTKVLISRVAFLVREHRIPPWQICCVTFTNKAANEMRERLKKLVGVSQTQFLVMGTFHALCAKFLRKYGSRISLPNNFTICDAEESKKIISKIMKSYADDPSVMSIQMKETDVLSAISKAKAKGLTPHQMEHANKTFDLLRKYISRIYVDYTAVLAENNSLDFDDLLIFGVKLFTKVPDTTSWCYHILVDEFQDTNSVQYELMVRLSSAHRHVTIVGDPDQSIYGWRSAEITNLSRMRTDFPSTQQIILEENYRSTGSILAACLAIIAEDKSRIPKSLRTSHARGTTPTLRPFTSEQAEAEFIAAEIKRLIAYHGGLLGWSDFVILLRFNALSRVVETALQKEGIPNRVLAGQKFFERLEIKDILAYLHIIDNPRYTLTFHRAANTPPRGIGEKSLSELSTRAKALEISPMELVEQICLSKTPDIKPVIKRKLDSFVKTIMALRKMANEGASVPDLIRRLLGEINYEDHLKKSSQQDWEARWENVQELINFASQYENGATGSATENINHHPINVRSQSQTQREREIIDLVSDDGGEGIAPGPDETPLRLFLQASMLSTDTETKNESQGSEAVTISTCHSAKGLEWPVVFIPAVEKDSFPFYRAEDIEEERRLLYVACTRAQALLYLSYSTMRMKAGEWISRDISQFILAVIRKNSNLFSQSPPDISVQERQETAYLLGREPVNEDTTHIEVQEYAQKQDARDFEKTAVSTRINQLGRLKVATAVRGAHSELYCSEFMPRSGGASAIPISFVPTYSERSLSVPLRNHIKINSNVSLNSRLVPVHSVPLPINHQGVLGTNPTPNNLKHDPVSLLEGASSDAKEVADHTSPNAAQGIRLAAGKRRLGMGRIGTGYPSKKAKDD